MRIKFLAIIASFLFVSIAISSCLDSDDTVELSSDATVHAFGIDTVYGKHYKFTIDQLRRKIYNQDSLPIGADTIIDRILIDTFTVSGWITSRDEMNSISGDTIFNRADSVNLTKAINTENGMKFKIHAPDGFTVNEYSLEIRVHKQDPDSLVWDKWEAHRHFQVNKRPSYSTTSCGYLHNLRHRKHRQEQVHIGWTQKKHTAGMQCPELNFPTMQNWNPSSV